MSSSTARSWGDGVAASGPSTDRTYEKADRRAKAGSLSSLSRATTALAVARERMTRAALSTMTAASTEAVGWICAPAVGTSRMKLSSMIASPE